MTKPHFLVTCLLYSSVTYAQHPLDGIWILEGGRADDFPAPLTAAGTVIQDNYDLLNDDPSLRCEPASLARVWGNPNTRTGIRILADHVELEHELFDLRRTIPGAGSSKAGHTVNLGGTEFPSMGEATYTMDGDRLQIQSVNLGPGYLRTGTGYPQGAGATATETLWREGDYLILEQVYHDPVLFSGEFRIRQRLTATGERSVPIYSCMDADYDWFEQLNADALGEQ